MQLRIYPHSLLWHTRGRFWDYEFVCLPKDPLLSSWWLAFHEVFGQLEPDAKPAYGYGRLPPSSRRLFFAAAYRDRELRDEFGRPIYHRLMWFPSRDLSSSNVIDLHDQVPENWALQIVEKWLCAWFYSIFDLAKDRIKEKSSLEAGLCGYFNEDMHRHHARTTFELTKSAAMVSSKQQWKEIMVRPGSEICPEAGSSQEHTWQKAGTHAKNNWLNVRVAGVVSAGIAALIVASFVVKGSIKPRPVTAQIINAFVLAHSNSAQSAKQIVATLLALPRNHLPKMDGKIGNKVYRMAAPATVLIESDLGGDRVTLGSGSLLMPDGRVLTSDHIIHGAHQVTVFFFPKKGVKQGQGLSASIIREDPRVDLGLLQVLNRPRELPYLRLADLSNVQVGDSVYAIENPQDLSWSYTTTRITAIRHDYSWEMKGIAHRASAIQTQTRTNPGTLGGALLNRGAELLGVNTWATKDLGINRVVAADIIRTFLDEAPIRSVTSPTATGQRDNIAVQHVERYGELTGVYLNRKTAPPDVWLFFNNGGRQPAYGAHYTKEPGRIDQVIVSADPDWRTFVIYFDINCHGSVDLIAYHDADGSIRYELPTRSITLSDKAPGLRDAFVQPNFRYFGQLKFCSGDRSLLITPSTTADKRQISEH